MGKEQTLCPERELVRDFMDKEVLQEHKDNINRMFIDFLCHPDNKLEDEELTETVRYTHYSLLCFLKDCENLMKKEEKKD